MQWLKGNYVPTEAKLRSMVESGFVFPETCKAILKPMEVLELLVQCLADNDDPSLGIHFKIIHISQVATPMDYFQFHSDADNEEVGYQFTCLGDSTAECC